MTRRAASASDQAAQAYGPSLLQGCQGWVITSQASPGVFNENTFRALDWLLDEARLHGLRVVLSFIDNWKYPGMRRAPHNACNGRRRVSCQCQHLSDASELAAC